MLRRTIPRLFVRLLILTTLVSALLLTSADVNRKTVHANLWCPGCSEAYDQCLAGCPTTPPGIAACYQQCRYEFDVCNHNCK